LTFDLKDPMASLTVTMFNYVMGPYHYWHQQSWAAAFILTMGVLLLSIIARVLLQRNLLEPLFYIVRSITGKKGG
jgi:phosphate transport system permease protein